MFLLLQCSAIFSPEISVFQGRSRCNKDVSHTLVFIKYFASTSQSCPSSTSAPAPLDFLQLLRAPFLEDTAFPARRLAVHALHHRVGQIELAHLWCCGVLLEHSGTFVHANLKADFSFFSNNLDISHTSTTITMGDSTKHSPKAESVDEDTIVVEHESSPAADRDLEMSLLQTGSVKDERVVSASNSPSLLPTKLKSSPSSSSTSVKSRATSESSVDKKEVKDKVGGDVTLKMEPGQPPKLSRSASQKVVSRAAPLFDDLPDATVEAKSSFSAIDACTYSNKFLGYTEHAMECDCSEEWGKQRPLRQRTALLRAD